ncbi:MAG: GNAT family N-acetyltransferase [Bacteroidales bacterium]|nr:GNAT family N-acetyltransferase [Bacteroidales bacterium]
MENIIAPIDRAKLLEELTDDKLLRITNYGGNKIYVFDAHNSPNLMLEVGRLRELSFRGAGGGTGKKVDIDEADTAEFPYSQLIVWNDEHQEILGGYRFIDLSKNIVFKQNGQPELSTSEIFDFSEKFIKEYMPHSIELGRSFVQPKFQSKENFKLAIFALDNLWDGLGALYRVNEDHIKYFFGKVTMYRSYNQEARDYILSFLNLYFKDKDNLVIPREPLEINLSQDVVNKTFCGNDYKKDYKTLNHIVRAHGENIPPLVNSYMNLSSTMRCFGTALNPFFGDVEETGILIKVDDVYPDKKSRHLDTYKKL